MKFSFVFLATSLAVLRSFGDSGPIYTENGNPRQLTQTEEEIFENLAKQNTDQRSAVNAQKDENDEMMELAGAAFADRPLPPDEFRSDIQMLNEQPAEAQTEEPAADVREEPVVQEEKASQAPPVVAAKDPQFVIDMSAVEPVESVAEPTDPPVKRQGQLEVPFPPPMPQPQPLKAPQPAAIMSGDKRASIGSANQTPEDVGDTIFIAVTALGSALAVFGVAFAGVYWYRLRKQYKAAQESEYPQYGVTGPKQNGSGHTSPTAATDAKLAQSAQLYHYLQTKQQILSTEHTAVDHKGQESDESDGEGDEGDYSVYECPGLAPTGDIEISNPLFDNGVNSSPKKE